MGSKTSLFTLLACLALASTIEDVQGDIGFDEGYGVSWGFDRVWDQGNLVQLSMDASSGSGFQSKQSYGSGFFHMRIKLPDRDSAGVVTAFYLSSNDKNHDELDFEFLGNREGKPYTLQTNVFANGRGEREQRLRLWFDPTAHFHNYQILWNEHQIVFFVDNIPVRVHKNNVMAPESYPRQSMRIQGSLWDGSSWATDGGQTKIDWNYAPFRAYFEEFDISGCVVTNPDGDDAVSECHGSQYWWNSEKYWKLSVDQQRQYDNVKLNFINYDYCTDRPRYPIPPPECFE